MKKQFCLFFTFIALISSVHANVVNWSTSPTVLSGENVNASDAQIAIDPSGNAVAVWLENDSVLSRSKLFGNDWSDTTILSESEASNIKIGLDPYGNATAIWIENGAVKAASKMLGKDWRCDTILSASNSDFPVLAIGSEGDTIAAWVTNGNIETSTKPFGSEWQKKVTLNTPPAYHPSMQISGSGSNARAVLVWEAKGSGINTIFASTKLIKGNWSYPKVISDFAHNAAKPCVAIDQKGNAIAVWYEYDFSGRPNEYCTVVKSSAFSSSIKTWDRVADLSLPGICNPETLKAFVGFDANGNAVALWTNSYDNRIFSLESAIKPLDGTWSHASTLASTKIHEMSADLAVISKEALALYMVNSEGSLTINAIELSNNWNKAITISEGNSNAFPKIAASGSGDVVHVEAIWISNNGVNNRVVSSTGLQDQSKTPTENKKRYKVKP